MEVIRVLVIIPAYNEAGNIASVIRQLQNSCPTYDYIIVNDSSTDATVRICRENRFSYLDLPINLGIGGGVQTGYLYAKEQGYDIAVQLDGDGQHNSAHIQQLIQPICDGTADLVIGSRFLEKEGFQSTPLRRFGIVFLGGVIRLCCGFRATDATSGFRAASRDLIAFFAEDYAHDYPEPEAIVSTVLNGYVVAEVPARMNARMSGESSISGLRSAYYMIKVSLALLISRIRLRKKRRARA